MEKDIRRAFQSLHQSVGKVQIRFPGTALHQDIAKTVCVLQILGNLPISVQNITSLMHPGISDTSSLDEVKAAVEDLITDAIVPFGEKDGQLCFFSEKLNDIEQDRATIPLRVVELRRIQNEALKEAYSPLPSTNLHGNLSVQTGLKTQASSGLTTSIAGDRNTVQTIVEIVDPNEYETTKLRLTDESRHKSAQYHIFLFGRSTPEMEELTNEIFRSREIVSKYRIEPDQEVKEYCNGQVDRANRLMDELERFLKRSLVQGSFIFRGELTAVESLNQDLIEASRKHLAGVAEQVFDRFTEAPYRAVTDLAEKFLRLGNLTEVTTNTDPLNLVQNLGGRPSINTEHKAITSVRDMIERQGAIEGKRLIDIFTDAPFGWSQDTLRYLVSAMLLAGEIKLKVAGREVTVNGQQAIDALKTNNTFRSVGISLRDERPGMEILAKAAERLTELSGDMVVPLEDEISKTTTKLFPEFQHAFGPLVEKLKSLDLPGQDQLETLNQEIKDILFNDASDAPQRLGGEDSLLYANLKWATELKQSLEHGLEETLRELQKHRLEIASMPDSATPGVLKSELEDEMGPLKEHLNSSDFFHYSKDYASALTHLKSRVRDAVIQMADEQKNRIKDCEKELSRIAEWKELTGQEQNSLLADLETLVSEATKDLSGLRVLVNQEYTIQSSLQDLKNRVQKIGQQRLQEKLKEEQEEAKKAGQKKITRQLKPRKQIISLNDLDELIQELQQIRGELQYAHEFELTFDFKENSPGKRNMAFDQSTRNRLQKFVSEVRSILTEEFTRQLQASYGMDPRNGSIAELNTLDFLDNQGRQAAVILRETLAHYVTALSDKSEKERTKQALDRVVQEQAFTVLNRLAALRMAESRGFLIESISKGYSSKGFQLYKNLARVALGETGDAYRQYLISLFDEFSLSLSVLFDRHSKQGLLFPREAALLSVLEQINHFEIEPSLGRGRDHRLDLSILE